MFWGFIDGIIGLEEIKKGFKGVLSNERMHTSRTRIKGQIPFSLVIKIVLKFWRPH